MLSALGWEDRSNGMKGDGKVVYLYYYQNNIILWLVYAIIYTFYTAPFSLIFWS